MNSGRSRKDSRASVTRGAFVDRRTRLEEDSNVSDPGRCLLDPQPLQLLVETLAGDAEAAGGLGAAAAGAFECAADQPDNPR